MLQLQTILYPHPCRLISSKGATEKEPSGTHHSGSHTSEILLRRQDLYGGELSKVSIPAAAFSVGRLRL
jgi:hypothetical protein